MNVLYPLIRILDSYPFQLAVCANVFALPFAKRRGFLARMALWLVPMFVAFDLGVQYFPEGVYENYLLDRATLLLPMTLI